MSALREWWHDFRLTMECREMARYNRVQIAKRLRRRKRAE